MTTTVLPRVDEPSEDGEQATATSAKWRPVVGSSRT